MKLQDRLGLYAEKLAFAFASPVGVVSIPVVCSIWLAAGLSTNGLTLALSILAISMTQLVLLAQQQEAIRTKAQTAEIIKALPEARNELANLEGLAAEDISQLIKD